jgi:hypothetical protein
MASSGTFPTVQGLWQAVAYAILLSFLRLILTRILFKPLANYSLNLKSPAGFKEFPAIDKFIEDIGTETEYQYQEQLQYVGQLEFIC